MDDEKLIIIHDFLLKAKNEFIIDEEFDELWAFAIYLYDRKLGT